MNITKCDKCKKIKKEKNPSLHNKSKWISTIVRGQGDWFSFDLCGECGEKVVKFLRKYLRIKKSKN